jgi:hypothetical protein
MVEHLSSKCDTLSSNPRTIKKEKRERGRAGGREEGQERERERKREREIID